MEFSEKLGRLMALAGISNSRLARNLKVDPSLVSRWRSGTRNPANNHDTLLRLSAQMAKRLTMDYHREWLATYTGDPALKYADEDKVTEAIFSWLSDAPLLPVRPAAPAPPAETPSERELTVGNGFAGIEGRRMVLKKLFELFDPNAPDEFILFYSSDPADWVRADIEFRSTMFDDEPDYFSNVSHVRLILNNSASVDEIVYSILYIIPFISRGSVQIAQIPRYRKELFTNTILIAGRSVAAASHGFAGSSNFMTNLYSDPSFVKQLTADFNKLFEASEPVHTTEYDITLLDALEESRKLLFVDQPIAYMGLSLIHI